MVKTHFCAPIDGTLQANPTNTTIPLVLHAGTGWAEPCLMHVRVETLGADSPLAVNVSSVVQTRSFPHGTLQWAFKPFSFATFVLAC